MTVLVSAFDAVFEPARESRFLGGKGGGFCTVISLSGGGLTVLSDICSSLASDFPGSVIFSIIS